MTDKRLVFSTVADIEEARKIARALVDKQLAACVNIVGPIHSIYRWNENLEESDEILLVIKTTAEVFPRLRDELKILHSYEVPECISVNIEDGLPEYLKWIGESVR
jgi:periplasmic divalent cation tolerance protein